MEDLSCWTRKRNDGSNYTVCKGVLRDNEMIKTKQAQLNALKRQYSLQEGMKERDRQAEGEDKKRLDRLGGDKRLAEVKAELAGMKEKDRKLEREELMKIKQQGAFNKAVKDLRVKEKREELINKVLSLWENYGNDRKWDNIFENSYEFRTIEQLKKIIANEKKWIKEGKAQLIKNVVDTEKRISIRCGDKGYIPPLKYFDYFMKSPKELMEEIKYIIDSECDYYPKNKEELLSRVIDNYEILTQEDISEEDREQFEDMTITELNSELEEQNRELLKLNKPREDIKKKILREM